MAKHYHIQARTQTGRLFNPTPYNSLAQARQAAANARRQDDFAGRPKDWRPVACSRACW